MSTVKEIFGITHNELTKLREFNTFIVKLYVKPWFESRASILAAHNDLEFLKNVKSYAKDNINISDKVFKTFSGHLWYLSKALIGLSFF